MASDKLSSSPVADGASLVKALSGLVAMIVSSPVPNTTNPDAEPTEFKYSLLVTRMTYVPVPGRRGLSLQVPSGHSCWDLKGSTEHENALKITATLSWYDPDTMVRHDTSNLLKPGGDMAIVAIYRFKTQEEVSTERNAGGITIAPVPPQPDETGNKRKRG